MYQVSIDTSIRDRGASNPPYIVMEGPKPVGGEWEFFYEVNRNPHSQRASTEDIWAIKHYPDTPLWSFMVGHVEDQHKPHRPGLGALGIPGLLANAWSSRCEVVNDLKIVPELATVMVQTPEHLTRFHMAAEVDWLTEHMPAGWWLETAPIYDYVPVSKRYPNTHR